MNKPSTKTGVVFVEDNRLLRCDGALGAVKCDMHRGIARCCHNTRLGSLAVSDFSSTAKWEWGRRASDPVHL